MSDSEISESEKAPEDIQAKFRSFILPIIFVILIAVVLSLFTLEFYSMIQENVIENNDFEEDSANWIISGTTFESPAYSGSKSAQITPGGYVAQDLSNIAVDDFSSFSFWIFDADNATIDFIVYYTDNTITINDFVLGDTRSWIKMNITGLTAGKYINKINITNTDTSVNINVDYVEFYVTEIPDISPIPENPEDPGGIAYGAILNMLFYVALAFIGGVIVLIVIKKGLMQLLVYFFAATMGFAWFIFGLFYGSVVLFSVLNLLWDFFPSSLQLGIISFVNWNVNLGSQNLNVLEALFYLFAAFLGLLGIFTFGIQTFDKIWLRNLMMVFFGAMIGSMLAIHIGLLTAFLILVGLSLYDIYAVFRGPLKGIIDHSRETAEEYEKNMKFNDEEEGVVYEKVPLLPALPVYSTPLINIGLGDFAFFSMLASTVVVISSELSNPIPLLMTLLGLFLGTILTFKFLENERALPGLPLPIFGGMGFLILSIIGGLVLGLFTIESIVALFT
jgi:hypothetical protein